MATNFTPQIAENKLKEILTEKIQEAVSKGETHIAIDFDVFNAGIGGKKSVVSRNVHRRFQEIAGNEGSSNGNLNGKKIKIEDAKYIVSGDKSLFDKYRLGLGPTSDAIGKYFEYSIYHHLVNKLKGKDSVSLVNLADKDFKKRAKTSTVPLGTRIVIGRYASDAANKYIERYITDGQNITVTVRNLGGTNPLGDLVIQFGNLPPILIEAKFYSNPSSIKYFELTDRKNFSQLFSTFLQQNTAQRFWYEKNGPILAENTWVQTVRQKGLESYVQDLLKSEGGYNPKSFARYMIAKGKQQLELELDGQKVKASKDIVIGGGASTESGVMKAFISIDADQIANNEALEKASLVLNETSISLKIKNLTLMRLTTSESEIASHAIPDSGEVDRTLVNQGWSTTFYLTLGKGFQTLTNGSL